MICYAELDEVSSSVICFLNFETPYHKRNIAVRQNTYFRYTNYSIQISPELAEVSVHWTCTFTMQ